MDFFKTIKIKKSMQYGRNYVSIWRTYQKHHKT
nr:MAG TPA: hypothetical protein [Caudoviricetes sp.]